MRRELESPADSVYGRPVSKHDWARRRDIAITLFIAGIALIVLLWLAGRVVSTLILLAVATLIAYALTPAVNALARRLPRWLSILIVYLIFVGLLVGFLFLIVNNVTGEVRSLIDYVRSLLTPGQGGSSGGAIQRLLSRFGISSTEVRNVIQGALGQARGLVSSVLPVISGIFTAGLDIIVITVLSVYFIADAPRIGRWLRTRSPLSQRERVVFVVETCNHVVGGYIRGQVTLSVLVGLLVGFGMQFLFHLPFAILLGILALVLEFIPFIGVFVSGLACVVVALLSGGFLLAVLVLGYFVIVHLIEGDVIGPRIVGAAVGIHPAISLIALIAGAELFGLWGALFAAPVAGVIQALISTFWAEYGRAHPEEFPDAQPRVPTTTREAEREAEGHFHEVSDPTDHGFERGISGLRGIFFPRRTPRHP